MENLSLFWVAIDVIISVIVMILTLKYMNDAGGFWEEIKRPIRILIRFILLIFSPILVPIFFIVSVFYFLFGWLIEIMFE